MSIVRVLWVISDVEIDGGIYFLFVRQRREALVLWLPVMILSFDLGGDPRAVPKMPGTGNEAP